MKEVSLCVFCKKEKLNCKCYVFYPEPSKQPDASFSERLALNKALALLRECREQIKDYEDALAKYPANSHAYNVLKKYKGEK